LGTRKALAVSVVLHIATTIFIISAGLFGQFNWVFWVGAVFYFAMLAYQHTLVKPGDLSKVNMAFANTNGIASIVFGLLTIVSLLMQ
jgi:4-hydroxybenzoate polyprenyltransferase